MILCDKHSAAFYGDCPICGHPEVKRLELQIGRLQECWKKAEADLNESNRLNDLYKSALDWIYGYALRQEKLDIAARIEEIPGFTEKRNDLTSSECPLCGAPDRSCHHRDH